MASGATKKPNAARPLASEMPRARADAAAAERKKKRRARDTAKLKRVAKEQKRSRRTSARLRLPWLFMIGDVDAAFKAVSDCVTDDDDDDDDEESDSDLASSSSESGEQ